MSFYAQFRSFIQGTAYCMSLGAQILKARARWAPQSRRQCRKFS